MSDNSPARLATNSSNAPSIVSWSPARVPLFEPFADSVTLDLSAAVDVYSDWVDACDAVAKEAEEGGGRGGGDYAPSSRPSARTSAGRARDEEEDDENDIIDDRDDDGYGGEGIVADDDDY